MFNYETVTMHACVNLTLPETITKYCLDLVPIQNKLNSKQWHGNGAIGSSYCIKSHDNIHIINSDTDKDFLCLL